MKCWQKKQVNGAKNNRIFKRLFLRSSDMSKNLLNKKCSPCEGGTSPFTKEEVEGYLEEVSEWHLTPAGSEISRVFKFKNFKEAIAFINKVADLAEEEGHHPDINLFSYKNVRLDLSTHAINGLSENDFILAAKINQLLQ